MCVGDKFKPQTQTLFPTPRLTATHSLTHPSSRAQHEFLYSSRQLNLQMTNMSSNTVINSKTIGLGAAIGLVIGPLIGYWLIRISNVGYLETSFATGRIAIGILIGFVIGVIAVIPLGDRVSSLSRRSVYGLFIFGVVVTITEIVIMIRRIIP